MTIGIIVTVYNVEPYVAQCLDSILGQSYGRFVIVLINDASTDSSGEICAGYQLRDERIIYVDVDSNAGVASTRNRALKILERGATPIQTLQDEMPDARIHARCAMIPDVEYVMFVDADDYLAPNALETIITDFGVHDVDMCIYNYHYVVDTRGDVEVHDYRIFPQVRESKTYTPLELISLNPKNIVTTTWAFVHRASFLFEKGFGFIDGISNEDMPFCTQAFVATQRVYVSFAKWYYYRLTPVSEMRGAMSAQKVRRFYHSWIVIAEFFIARYESIDKDTQALAQDDRALLKKFYKANIRRCLKRIFEILCVHGYSEDCPKERLKPYIVWGGAKYYLFYCFPKLKKFL